jgi:hypothetical protein
VLRLELLRGCVHEGVLRLYSNVDRRSTVLGATVARCAGASNACLPAPAPAALLLCQRNALNALLYRTGEASKNFMLVLATNRPDDLDSAVVDRVDEAMHFDLPSLVRWPAACWGCLLLLGLLGMRGMFGLVGMHLCEGERMRT